MVRETSGGKKRKTKRGMCRARKVKREPKKSELAVGFYSRQLHVGAKRSKEVRVRACVMMCLW